MFDIIHGDDEPGAEPYVKYFRELDELTAESWLRGADGDSAAGDEDEG